MYTSWDSLWFCGAGLVTCSGRGCPEAPVLAGYLLVAVRLLAQAVQSAQRRVTLPLVL